MPTFEIPQDIIDEWLSRAQSATTLELNEDWSAGFGGNYDDAYDWGEEDGFTLAYRTILQELGIKIT